MRQGRGLIKFGLYCVIGAGFLSVLPVFAAAGESLTWEECVREARQHHPDLVSAREKLNQAGIDKAATRSADLPQLSASASTERRSTSGTHSTANNYGVSAKQLLFDGFKSSNDLASSTEKIKAANYNYEVASSTIRLELWTAFVRLLGAQEALSVNQDIVKRRQDNFERVSLRYQVGREHKGSLLTAKANLSEAVYELEEARRNVELYQRQLSRCLGRATFVPLAASGSLDEQDRSSQKPDFEALLGASPLLKELVAKKEAARFDLESSRSELFPQVYANAGTSRSGSDWPSRTEGWSAGFSVSIPIFEGGKTQAKISKNRSLLEQARADERSGRDGVLFTLAEKWTDWRNSAEKVDIRREFLEASRQRAMIVEGQYAAGLVTFNDWTLIEDDLVNNQKTLLQARVSAFVAEGAWLQAKGVTLDEK